MADNTLKLYEVVYEVNSARGYQIFQVRAKDQKDALNRVCHDGEFVDFQDLELEWDERFGTMPEPEVREVEEEQDDSSNVEDFLAEYAALCKKHKKLIYICDCCDEPGLRTYVDQERFDQDLQDHIDSVIAKGYKNVNKTHN
jgi:hypothetical protein